MTLTPADTMSVSTVPLATVSSIASAPSFAGSLHQPHWRTFSLMCRTEQAAADLASHVRQHGIPATSDLGVASVRYDATQPSATKWPTKMASAAVMLGLADADEAVNAVLDTISA